MEGPRSQWRRSKPRSEELWARPVKTPNGGHGRAAMWQKSTGVWGWMRSRNGQGFWRKFEWRREDGREETALIVLQDWRNCSFQLFFFILFLNQPISHVLQLAIPLWQPFSKPTSSCSKKAGLWRYGENADRPDWYSHGALSCNSFKVLACSSVNSGVATSSRSRSDRADPAAFSSCWTTELLTSGDFLAVLVWSCVCRPAGFTSN